MLRRGTLRDGQLPARTSAAGARSRPEAWPIVRAWTLEPGSWRARVSPPGD